VDIRKYNQKAWDKKVTDKSQWTIPVDSKIVKQAREGHWSLILTPTKPVPSSWFPGYPNLMDQDILALASGGGQQGPVLAAAGARVTVFDNSPAQLAQDRMVATRHDLEIRTVEGDMADLSVFPDNSFDLIFHPVSNCFVPDPMPVWREAYRVLRSGGSLLSGIMNPDFYIFDYLKSEREGVLEVRHKLPYNDFNNMSKLELDEHLSGEEALEFSHSMDSLLGGANGGRISFDGFL